MNRWMIGSGLVLSLLAAGCGRGRETENRVEDAGEDVMEEAQEAVDAVGSWAFARKGELEEGLEDLSARMEDRIRELGDEAGDQAARLREAMEERRATVREALADVGEATEDKWEEARDAAARAMEDASDWLDRQVE